VDSKSQSVAGRMPEGFDTPRDIGLPNFLVPTIQMWDILGLALHESAKDWGISMKYTPWEES